MELSDERCVPCRDGAPTLTSEELDDLLPSLSGWRVVDHHHLHKVWSFPDFQSALNWLNRAGAVCEAAGHHANFCLGWGRVEAAIRTHDVDGLTRADADLAAKLDAIGETPTNPYGGYAAASPGSGSGSETLSSMM
ncbi:4a-hydroxytetrahydrobiopterin dehydratase [Synechococcus sp. J7-Johnson]|uniref:4a-hydroxytetrahydrobiopterin dehydratase n=1 Tax=Synechococcus sp. J7-Johnson TaxID=2823737 RepID=UPI0020CD5C69|nr:4a-hydroxytetrahydrobiopterin dehydratase [Synechococcus sp. J7-Johnson]MCP9840038.1 4a-hydroxytetrahydrobiopterin dehydratase [Synechococcus sp. J7-Johnson]